MAYNVVSQTAAEVGQEGNAPATSMWPYLVETDQGRLLNQISIYSAKGTTRDQLRLLYMNTTALRVWRAMGKEATVVGEVNRPPMTALLSFGMPFGE